MKTQPLALIVDDEPDIRELLGMTLAAMDITTACAANLAQARQALQGAAFDLCLTDMRLPDGNGIDLVRFAQRFSPQMPIAVITAHGNMELAIEALKAGAFDFVSKPVDLKVLRGLVMTAVKLSDRPRKPGRLLIGNSRAIEATRQTIAKLARSQAPVYISGESGTGKELAARLIHEQGPRAERAFVPVNCGAIPEELMESEFFGHKKGSFTGAVADKLGLFQAADGGTLFLDEVADLPIHMQVKLLRAIQEKSVRAVGDPREAPVDVRILSATHRNLDALVREGRLRQDLYYRINVIELHLPALRERAEDIPLLAEHILARLARDAGPAGAALSEAAHAALRAYHFPGNVRELENILERALTLCEGHIIDVDALGLETAEEAARSVGPETPAMVPAGADLDAFLVSVEKDTIVRALEQTRWNKTAAAKVLGITFGALRYRLQKLGLE
nr:sigma-54-dependent Fis family transcriptional regulator [Gammaproteobacteria bacterium]